MIVGPPSSSKLVKPDLHTIVSSGTGRRSEPLSNRRSFRRVRSALRMALLALKISSLQAGQSTSRAVKGVHKAGTKQTCLGDGNSQKGKYESQGLGFQQLEQLPCASNTIKRPVHCQKMYFEAPCHQPCPIQQARRHLCLLTL
jgi:hypothetical protein